MPPGPVGAAKGARSGAPWATSRRLSIRTDQPVGGGRRHLPGRSRLPNGPGRSGPRDGCAVASVMRTVCRVPLSPVPSSSANRSDAVAARSQSAVRDSAQSRGRTSDTTRSANSSFRPSPRHRKGPRLLFTVSSEPTNEHASLRQPGPRHRHIGARRRIHARHRRPHRRPIWPGRAGAALPCGLAAPAHSAMVQQFLRGRSDSRPSTSRPACRRGSTRANRAAIRPMATSNASRQRAGSVL